MPDLDNDLLFTKMHRPPVTRDLVVRPRLIQRLNEGLDGYITLVSAAAGFGKSTLVSSWIETLNVKQNHDAAPLPVMWLSLDENDSDLFLLIRYIITTIRMNFPEIGNQTLELIQGSPLPPNSLIAKTFFNEIDRISKNFIIVLDDYSAIKSPDIHTYLKELILHWPTHMHLVLITRTNPPLPYGSLRAQGNINEIHDADLRFSLEETTTYLEKLLPMNLQQETIIRLEEETEGWIAGLQMAAMTLRNSDNPDTFLEELSGTDIKIADYLLDEVLSKQPAVIQKFLLRTSVLDRFSAELCKAVIGNNAPEINVPACLEEVKRTNLFVIPLDNKQEWFRYHHLFQDLLIDRLQKEMDAKQIAKLHLRAANWFASKGYTNDAINHSVKTGDFNLTAQLMEQGLCDVLNREDRATLERWLRHHSEEFVNTRPGLMMVKAWVFFFSSQIYMSFGFLHQLENQLFINQTDEPLSKELQVIKGQMAGLFCQEAYFNNQTQLAIELAQEGLKLLSDEWSFVRGRLMMYLAFAMQSNGQAAEAETYLREQYESLNDKTGVQACYLLLALGMILFRDGKYQQAASYFRINIRQTSPTSHVISHYWAHLLLALVLFHLNDLDLSKDHLSKIISHSYSVHFTTFHQALSTMALIDQIQCRSEEAWDHLEHLSDFDLEKFGDEAPDVQSIRARLWFHEGNLEKAFQWADRFQMPVPDKPLPWNEIPHLTKARILITRNQPGDIHTAIQLLDALNEIAKKTHDIRCQMEILATRAIALDIQGNRSTAQSALSKVLSSTRSEGNIRTYLDNGPQMAEMLKELARQGSDIPDILPILKAFSQDDCSKLIMDPNNPQTKNHRSGIPQVVEPLTNREYDILVLLHQRLSNKEIAEKLNLSTLTVKTHLKNIYEKFGVEQRWDAVTRAIELGILPKS